MTMTENPRAVAGDNTSIDYARETHDQLDRDYAGTINHVTALLDEARALPKEIDSDETLGIVARVIKRIRDLAAQVEAYRQLEKEPHLRRGNAVDNKFNGLSAKLLRAKKTDNAGAGDILQDRVNKFMAEKESRERAIREEAERVAREVAQAAERERLAAEQRQREAEATAARARNAEKIAEAQKIAEQAKRDAEIARNKAAETAAVHSDAKADANAKPSDLTRTRLDDGVLVTTKQEWRYEIEDRSKIDMNELSPYFKDDEIVRAFKQWCKTSHHRKSLIGLTFTQRNTASVR